MTADNTERAVGESQRDSIAEAQYERGLGDDADYERGRADERKRIVALLRSEEMILRAHHDSYNGSPYATEPRIKFALAEVARAIEAQGA